MDQLQAQELCSMLGLGMPRGDVQPVSGGLLHRMWRLTTTSGVYAAKELDPAFLGHPSARAYFENTERIASLMARAGIPTVAAINAASGPVLVLGAATFLVYEWIDGSALPPGPVDPATARKLGTVLGRIHHVDTAGAEWPQIESEVDTFR